MDLDLIILWLVCPSSLLALIVVWMRLRFSEPGWIALYLAVLLLSVAGWLSGQSAIVYAAAAIWLVFAILPGILARVLNRRVMQQNYVAARRLARIISWLHPADGMRELPRIAHALQLAQRGDVAAASDALSRFQNVKSSIGLAAMTHLFRITNQWEELLAWLARHQQILARNAQFLPIELRARGELGDLRGLVEFYDRNRKRIAKLAPSASRDVCRLMLFAFCGQRQAVQRLFAGNLALLPATVRAFWLATADLHAGESESARRQFEELLPAADSVLRPAILQRLSQVPAPPQPLDEAAQHVIDAAAAEHDHEQTFGATPSLFSPRARATQILIVLNLVMFGVESCLGGGTNTAVLYRLGALSPLAVHAGQWWRLLTSVFLHFGAVHLAMNMLALWLFGPFVEFALGFRRFLLLYLLTGIGSMATVLVLSSGVSTYSLTVGASGSIMGLIGATAALMLRGWLREDAHAAKRRLGLMVLLVLMQVVFDSTMPQVSGTAHLSGVVIGFAIATVLADRLRSSPPEQPAPQS